jgi:hypothetical protein
MQALLKRKQKWKNQELRLENEMFEISNDQMEAVLDRALGIVHLLFSVAKKGGIFLWELIRIACIGRRLIRHQAPGVYEELNEYEQAGPPRLF